MLRKKIKNVCGNNYERRIGDTKRVILKETLFYKPMIVEIVKEAKRAINYFIHFFDNICLYFLRYRNSFKLYHLF